MSARRSQLWESRIEIAPRVLQATSFMFAAIVAIDMARLRRIGKSSNVISLCRRPHWPLSRKGAQFDYTRRLYAEDSLIYTAMARTLSQNFPPPREYVLNLLMLCVPQISSFPPIKVTCVGRLSGAGFNWRKTKTQKTAIHPDDYVCRFHSNVPEKLCRQKS